MYPGGDPTRRLTACFSMYSDMSIRIIASSSPKRKSARVRASSVLPTPEGPRKMNEPADRFRDGGDRDLLADHPLVEFLLHPDQLLGLGLGQFEDGDAGPHRDDVGDLLFAHLGPFAVLALGPLVFELALAGG